MRKKRGIWWTYVIVFLSLSALPVAAENGCFTEPSYVARSGGCGFISEVTAETSCRNSQGVLDQTCINTYFIRASSGITSCDAVSACAFRPGTWCGDTCEQVNYQAQCTNRGAWVNLPQQPSQCVEGCCVCVSGGGICDPADPFKNQNQCTTFCQAIGGVAVFDTSMSAAQCTNTCGNLVISPVEISGTVKDAGGVAIVDAAVRAFGVSATTDSAGSYQLRNLPSGDVVVSVSHHLFESKQVSITLSAGERKQVDFQLSPLGMGGVRGRVTSGSSAVVGAQLIVRRTNGQSVGQGVTDTNGVYAITGIAFGEYTVSTLAVGYNPQSASVQTSSVSPLATADFALTMTEEGIVNGQVVDQHTGTSIPFARVYMNGIFVRHSGTDGLFSLQLPASLEGVTYVLSVQHPDYQSSASQNIVLKTGERVTPTFALLPIVKECVHPISKAVEQFTAQHIPGSRSVRLTWTKACNEVAAYVINRTVFIPALAQSLSETVAYVDVVPGLHPLSAIDANVEWGTTYEYIITAVYTDVQPRSSEKKTVRITTGDVRCENRHSGQEFVEFCDSTGRLRQRCTPENQVASATSPGPANCAVLGSSFYCASVGVDTTCKDSGVCTSLFQNANPFGLWFARQSCYGVFNSQRSANFCTFDRTHTIFDACIACNNVKSCFSYKGEEACLINNCGVGSCAWVDSIPELGAGYCVDTDAQEKFGTQHCERCGTSDESSLFANAACTGAVCSALGACYATPDSSRCIACNDQSTCSDFTTEAECSNGVNAHFDFGELQPSKDSCSLQRCSWDGQQCFKDGNGDGGDDCEGFIGDTLQCRRDNKAPVTTLRPDVIRIGELTDQVTFSALDENSPGRVYYCVDRTNDCLPETTSFHEYGGSGTLSLSLGTLGLESVYNRSPTYFIRYFSEDVFFNREDIKSKRFVADLDAPTISLNYTVQLHPTGSSLLFTLVLDEPAVCRDTLSRRGMQRTFSNISTQRNSSFVVLYGNQSDGSYTYNASCTDEFGNTASHFVPVIDIDALNFVTVVSPAPATAESTFAFVVRSTDPSDCELYDGDTRVELMTSADHLTHRSSPKTFSANVFYSSWRVVCTELSSGEKHEKFIPFTVDKQPPRTSIELVSEDGLVRTYNFTNWTTFMSTVSQVHFLCDDFPQEAGQSVGFGCKETRSCIASVDEPRCTPTTAALPVVRNSSTICFFSSDKGGNGELEKCGKVILTPSFGIELIQPPHGISPFPEFDLEIGTRIPSLECKWVGAPPNGMIIPFNFTTLVTANNIFSRVNPYRFEIKNFSSIISLRDGVPAPIIIRCLSSTMVVSPPQLFAVGFDTTIPRITSARAEPELVTQGNTVDLVVETDEPTLCKYGKKSSELTTSFPGFEQFVFQTEHRTTHSLTTHDDRQSHAFNVSCQNRAGNMSSVARIAFGVDFSAAGTITSTEPSGVLTSTNVVLAARTNKDAFCELGTSNGTSVFYEAFPSSGALLHTAALSNLNEGSYAFRVRCSFFAPSVTRDALINFTIDRTPPVITAINDGNNSCEKPPLPNIVATDAHSSVVAYLYQLFEKPLLHIVNGTLNSSNNIFPPTNLSVGKTYFFKIKPIDSAGNVGVDFASDGFGIISANSSTCRNDTPPLVMINQTVVRTGSSVSVRCVDDNGCSSTKYGTSERQELCQANSTYTLPVAVQRESFFCVLAIDTAGNTATRSEKITVPDDDKDGVTNPFDRCANTPSGETVDVNGCSTSELITDADKDGLDDAWELRNDEGTICPLDPRDRDTDGDGVNDGDEDYDNDGMNNKEEFRMRNDPCAAASKTPDAGNITRPSSPAGTPSGTEPSDDEESSPLAALFIIFGAFFAFAGGAYLGYVHFYQKRAVTPPVPRQLMTSPPVRMASRIPPQAREIALKRQEARREAERHQRSMLFSAFGDTSPPPKKVEEKKPTPALGRVSKDENPSEALSKLREMVRKNAKK